MRWFMVIIMAMVVAARDPCPDGQCLVYHNGRNSPTCLACSESRRRFLRTQNNTILF